MADTTSRIRIIFDGEVERLTRAARAASQGLDRFSAALDRNKSALDKFDKVGAKLNSGLLTMAKGFVVAGGASASLQGAVAVVGTLANVTAQLAPAALAVPGIILGLGVAYGTAKLALTGFTDAVKGDAEALAQFSAEGQKTVQAVRGLEVGFKAMRSAVQDKFFANLAPEIKATGSELLVLGRDHLPKVASGFNEMAKAALVAMRNPFFKDDLTIIIGNTAAALGKMRLTLANVISGFVGLGGVGSKYLPALAAAVDDVAARFKRWVDQGVENNSIVRMIDQAIAAFKTLGRITADVGAGLGSLFSAFNQGLTGGGGTLEAIERVTQAFRELAASNEAQAAFKSLGEVVKAAGDAFRLVLTTAVRELGPVIVDLTPFLVELVTVIGERMARAIQFVSPYLREFAQFLSENRETIAPIVATLLRLAVAFKALQIVRTVIGAIRTFSNAISTLITRIRNMNPNTLRAIAAALRRFLLPVAIAVGVSQLAEAIDEANLAAAGGDPEKMSTLAQALHNFRLAGEQLASGDFKGIFAEIGQEWDLLVQKFQAGESPMGAVAQSINKFFDDLEVSLQGSLTKIRESFQRDFIDFFTNLPDVVGTFIRDKIVTPFTEGLAEFQTTVQTKFDEVRKRITDFFTNPAGEGFDIGAAVGQMIIDFLNGFATFATDTKAKLDETVEKVRTFVTVDVPNALSTLGATLRAKASEAWESFKAEAKAKIDQIVADVQALPGKVGAALAALPGILLQKAKDAWDRFFGETRTGGTRSTTEAGTVPGKIGAALAALPGLLLGVVQRAWQGWINEQKRKIDTAIADVRALPGKVVAAIGNLGGTLLAAGASLIQGFIDGIRSKIAGIRAAAAEAAAAARGFFGFSPAKEGPLSGRGWTLYSGHALVEDFAAGIRRSIPTASAAAAALARATSGALDPAISITSAFEAAQLARAQQQAASRTLLGSAVNQVTAVATREQPAPVTNVTVLLSREQIAEIARVVVESSNRETARRVIAGAGATY
jgi:hypothetical protein